MHAPIAAGDPEKLPYMLYADRDGRIYEHPDYRMAGFSGSSPFALKEQDLLIMPEFSKLFFIPGCPPVGLDPSTGQFTVVSAADTAGGPAECFAVAAFLEPGLVRSHLPAVDYRWKAYVLPMWAYTAAGFREDLYWAAAFPVEYNPKWDPRNYDDRELLPALEAFQSAGPRGPLAEHLARCATENHCFAAKNLFLGRWEAPIPVSRTCNAACLGCLSLQPQGSCDPSHHRIAFRPAREEIVSLAVGHLNRAEEAIVSFGQGCEGEPLTEFRLIAESIAEIRRRTDRGTINLNTNGSWPERVRRIAACGLDSIRISLNSARPEFYRAYYRPRGYGFEDVVASISLSKDLGLYTMLNYLVFPGISDQEEELEALVTLVRRTGLNFLHLKNLNIDPQIYLEAMPKGGSRGVGMQEMVARLKGECPDLRLGYFNQPVR